MTKQDPERRLDLSPAQVAGSALAAMSGAVFISWAGTAGTLIGAAAGSVIGTVGAATYTWSLRRTRDAARRTADRVRQTALAPSALSRTIASGPFLDEESEATPTTDEPESQRRWDLPWGKVALASLAVMVAGMAGITAIETVTGRSVSSYTGGDNQGTTLGSVVGSGQHTTKDHTAKKKTKVTSTGQSTPTPASEAAPTPAAGVPAPSTPATPEPSTDPTPTPSTPSTTTPDPGTDANGQQ